MTVKNNGAASPTNDIFAAYILAASHYQPSWDDPLLYMHMSHFNQITRSNPGFATSLTSSHPTALDMQENTNHSRLERIGFDHAKTPIEYICPITGEIILEPAFIANNDTPDNFELAAIQQWCKMKATCPVSRASFELSDIQPNNTLKSDIAQFIEAAETEYLRQRQIVPADYFKASVFSPPKHADTMHNLSSKTNQFSRA